MPFYQNSIIYKLKHNEDYDDLNIYVGSTTNFKNRKNQHKSACFNNTKKDYYYKVYEFIRNNGNWDNWVMIPIENFPCNNKLELQIRERYHIDFLKPKLNCCIPTRTDKEYRDDNKEILNEKYKIFYNNNKKRIKNYKAEKIVCDKCNSIITRSNLSQHQKTKKCADLEQAEKDCLKELESIRKDRNKLINMLSDANNQAENILKEKTKK